MSDERFHFWYSQKQAEAIEHLPDEKGYVYRNFIAVDGKERRYTECSTKAVPSGKWLDYEYIGDGYLADVRTESRRV